MIAQDKPIFLIGYMGSGKTTIGKMLAESLHWHFADTDDLLEAQCGMLCSQLMKTQGEESFRQQERQILEQVATRPQTVIATGGGMPCWADNVEVMNNSGQTFFLDWSVENLAIRLELTDIESRPMLRGKKGAALRLHIAEQLTKRRIFYEQANYKIDCNSLTDKEIANKIYNLIKAKSNDNK